MPRLIAVGDIHGQYNKLRNLMDKLEVGPGDELVFLGDYVDHGPQSADVIEYLNDQHKYRRWWFIMGDHDSQFLDYLSGGSRDPSWYNQGGRETLESYGWPNTMIPWDHLDFLKRLSRPISIQHPFGETEYILSHGMLSPGRPPRTRFDRWDALWGGPHVWDRSAYKTKFGSHVNVFGHIPHQGPTWFGQALDIDTNAATHGPLTAAILPPTLESNDQVEFLQAGD